MTRLYLVTGFLGAGKTTFLREFLKCFPGKRVALVINEFGREGVDGALLSACAPILKEIDNGSIFCACRAEQFREALLDALATGPDAVVVEASGLSDPTGMPALMAQPEFSSVLYQGCVCLVDASRFHKVYATARVCKKQVAAADAVVLNKTDLASGERLDWIRRELAALRPGIPVLETSFGRISTGWVEGLTTLAPLPGPAAVHVKDVTLQRATLVLPEGMPSEAVRRFLGMFAEDAYRVKGFFLAEGAFWLADCVGPNVSVVPWDGPHPNPGRLAVLFGNGQPALQSIQTAVDWYPQYPVRLER